MASPIVTSAPLQTINKIIDYVQNMDVSMNNNNSSGTTTNNNRIPIGTKDTAWYPLIPPGHTSYTWYGSMENKSNQQPVSAPQNTTLEQKQSSAQAATTTATQAAEKKTKQQQQQQGKQSNKPAAAKVEENKLDPNQPDISRLDIRVGRVVTAKKHPDADSLYVEDIDIGEEQPRQIVSGILKFVPLEEFIDSYVLVICNLKPAALKGVKSYGMVLAASDTDRTKVELIRPPTGSKPGEKIIIDGLDISKYNSETQIDPKKANNAWEIVKPKLKVNENMEACYDGKNILTSAGVCKPKSLTNAQIS